jgi:lipopolysaccharide/colanic/teichoic acid biosynthesis glycosyltransferase
MANVSRRIVALALLLFLLPLMAMIALALRIFQGQPVMFFQTRSGIGGRTFQIVKFRTMRDTRDADGQLLPDAARVTVFGNLLRRTRFDELPGLWNVVKGDLAFIGPRPLLPWTIEALGEAGIKRGSVPPGVTGWAQINGGILLTNDEKIALDLWYIANRSWRLDCKILVMTLWVMLAGEKPNASAIGNA